MLAIPVKRPTRTIALVLTVIALAYFGWTYWQLRSADEISLVPIALSERFGIIERRMANYELNRKIRSGEFSGADALFGVLLGVHGGYVEKDAGYEKADSLLRLGADIDARTSTGFSLLQIAILQNQPKTVEYLIERCTDPGVTFSYGDDSRKQFDALELVFMLEKTHTRNDYSRVIGALESRRLPARCPCRPFERKCAASQEVRATPQ